RLVDRPVLVVRRGTALEPDTSLATSHVPHSLPLLLLDPVRYPEDDRVTVRVVADVELLRIETLRAEWRRIVPGDHVAFAVEEHARGGLRLHGDEVAMVVAAVDTLREALAVELRRLEVERVHAELVETCGQREM